MTSFIWTDVAHRYLEALPTHSAELQDYFAAISNINTENRHTIDLTDDETFEAQRVKLNDLTKGSAADPNDKSACEDLLEAARFCQVHERFTKTHVREVPKRQNGDPDMNKAEWDTVRMVRRAEHVAKSTRDIVNGSVAFTVKLLTNPTGHIQYLERGIRAGSMTDIPTEDMYNPLRESIHSLCDATRRFYCHTHQGKIDTETLDDTASSSSPLKRRATDDFATGSGGRGPRRTRTESQN